MFGACQKGLSTGVRTIRFLPLCVIPPEIAAIAMLVIYHFQKIIEAHHLSSFVSAISINQTVSSRHNHFEQWSSRMRHANPSSVHYLSNFWLFFRSLNFAASSGLSGSSSPSSLVLSLPACVAIVRTRSHRARVCNSEVGDITECISRDAGIVVLWYFASLRSSVQRAEESKP